MIWALILLQVVFSILVYCLGYADGKLSMKDESIDEAFGRLIKKVRKQK